MITETDHERQAAYDDGYDDGRAAVVESLAGYTGNEQAMVWDDDGVTVRWLDWMMDEQWR